MIEVFKTNVSNQRRARQILKALAERNPQLSVNFDLQDCDKILRVQAEDENQVNIEEIISVVHQNGFEILRME